MIMNVYRNAITLIALVIAVILLISVIFNLHTSSKLKKQNKKYVILSQTSNEYIYEYSVKEKRLMLPEKFGELFTTPESINRVKEILWENLSNGRIHMPYKVIKLPLSNGKTGAFKKITVSLRNRFGQTYYIVGKLVDVSKDVEEKKSFLSNRKPAP